MWKPDVLRPDQIEDEVDLLENDNKTASYLLYSQVGFHD